MNMLPEGANSFLVKVAANWEVYVPRLSFYQEHPFPFNGRNMLSEDSLLIVELPDFSNNSQSALTNDKIT